MRLLRYPILLVLGRNFGAALPGKTLLQRKLGLSEHAQNGSAWIVKVEWQASCGGKANHRSFDVVTAYMSECASGELLAIDKPNNG
ncbi:hypothetical protein MACH24_08410 [Erythrobacter sp. Dej080120_24]|nr:hypothetical protein MACH24_08410 [Erythrobacter sp. Dej080120_24]